LIQNESIFKSFFTYTRARKDEQWARVIAHNIPIQPFNGEQGLLDLGADIRQFNQGIPLVGSPIWLTPRATREKGEKRYGSILLNLQSKEDIGPLLGRGKLVVAGALVKVEKYLEKQRIQPPKLGESSTI